MTSCVFCNVFPYLEFSFPYMEFLFIFKGKIDELITGMLYILLINVLYVLEHIVCGHGNVFIRIVFFSVESCRTLCF